MSVHTRKLLARVLVVVASIVLVLALIVGYVERAAVNSEQFANRATAALGDDSVRALVAEKITDEVVLKNQGDLLAARPIIETVASGVIGNRAFTSLFHAAVLDVHRALFNRDKNTVTLTVADVGTVLAAALEKLRPSLAKQVDATGKVELLQRDVGSLSGDLARTAEGVRKLAVFLLILTVLLVAGALVVSPDRRSTVVSLGIGAVAGGIFVVVAYAVLRSIAVRQIETPEGQDAASAVYDAFLGDLRSAGWILAASGAVASAAAASLIKPVDIREPLRRLGQWITTEPEQTFLKVVRGLVLIAVGLIVVFARDAVLTLVITVIGVYFIYEGVSAILRLVYRPGEEQPLEALEVHEATLAARASRPRRLVASVSAVGLIALVIALFVGSGGTTTAAPADGPCNGESDLCDRPFDEVVLPATHNSMSVPLPGWFSSEQEKPIPDQLDAGIRGLLIDTHYADRLPNGKLRTFVASREDLRKQATQDGVSPDAIDAALRIRERLGFSGQGERGMYLCHSFCELGGTELKGVLNEIHDFLVAHPSAVLVVINQDYVTPEDYVAAVKDAGLAEFAYRGPFAAGSWPTMQEMIDSGQRVVFLAENEAGGAPWYRLAYERITEETPYAFSKVPELTDPTKLPDSCEPNRGPEKAPLFLVNHWITTDPVPLVSNAKKVNAYEPLLQRARVCKRLRRHVPNLIAVNFYGTGDLFKVVDTLNGMR